MQQVELTTAFHACSGADHKFLIHVYLPRPGIDKLGPKICFWTCNGNATKLTRLSTAQVGLAVDDIKGVQDNAELESLAMQVGLLDYTA